jgi:hypothetical protein
MIRRVFKMDMFAERRKYQRCTKTICKALMSTDGIRWNNVELCDISAGGLRFSSKDKFDNNTHLKFDLNVYNALSEFNMKVEGNVLNSTLSKDKAEYVVKFDNINKYTQVQLDEIIKSKVTINNTESLAPDDGTYTFMFLRSRRPTSIKNKMRMLR